jgi:hypothetical protein
VAVNAICPICNKRRAERYCPAKGEKICAIDCGTEREVTIDCPSDCSYLIAAHRWEKEHSRTISEDQLAFPDAVLPQDLLAARSATLPGLIYAALEYARTQPSLTDTDIFDAVRSLAEAYRTLLAGIYYEKPPGLPVAAGLYAALAKFIEEDKKRQFNQAGTLVLKDADVFYLLVLIARLAQVRSNGRARSRIFLESLRAQFPLPTAPEEPRIVIP